MCKLGFDNEKYLELQSKQIRDRISHFGGKLYLEFGGKLFDDFHASRVLPGFAPDSKIRMLIELKDEAEIIISINSADIEKNKVRGDLGITYDLDVLRLIDAFRGYGLYVGSVVMTRFKESPTAEAFRKKLEALGIKVYKHYGIEGYPSNIPFILSDEGEVPEKRSERRITKVDLFENKLTGYPNSSDRRAALCRAAELPEDMTPNALLEALNLLFGYEGFLDLVKGLEE